MAENQEKTLEDVDVREKECRMNLSDLSLSNDDSQLVDDPLELNTLALNDPVELSEEELETIKKLRIRAVKCLGPVSEKHLTDVFKLPIESLTKIVEKFEKIKEREDKIESLLKKISNLEKLKYAYPDKDISVPPTPDDPADLLTSFPDDFEETYEATLKRLRDDEESREKVNEDLCKHAIAALVANKNSHLYGGIFGDPFTVDAILDSVFSIQELRDFFDVLNRKPKTVDGIVDGEMGSILVDPRLTALVHVLLPNEGRFRIPRCNIIDGDHGGNFRKLHVEMYIFVLDRLLEMKYERLPETFKVSDCIISINSMMNDIELYISVCGLVANTNDDLIKDNEEIMTSCVTDFKEFVAKRGVVLDISEMKMGIKTGGGYGCCIM